MRRESLLQRVTRHIDEAHGLLQAPTRGGVAAVQQRLQLVEDLLGALFTESELTADTAARVLVVRDELSVHLSAATTLDSLALHEPATTVLRRAVAGAQAGLHDLIEGDEVLASSERRSGSRPLSF